MKISPRHSVIVLSTILLSSALALAQEQKAPILQIKFEGESPDGIVSEISGPVGATVKVVKQGFNSKVAGSDGAPTQKVEVLKEPSMDGAYFLRVTRGAGAQICGVAATPGGSSNSLAALAPVGADGIPKPEGAIDAFFRSQSFEKAGDLQIVDEGLHGGLRLVIAAGQPQQGMVAMLQALSPEKKIDTDLDGNADAPQIMVASKGHALQPDKVYHVAVTLDTDAQGVTTLRLYQKEGTGPIRTDKDTDLVGKACGRLVGKFDGGFPEGAIRFGQFGYPKKESAGIQDFANLRLYDSVPQVFPDIHE